MRYNGGDSNESERGPVVHTEPAPNHTGVDPDMATAKSTKSPAFQFYPRDFLVSRKVDRMSMTERGIYITLLAHCWIDRGLTTDLAELAATCRMKVPQFERIWTRGQLRHCFELRGDRLQNPRLDVERRAQAEYSKKQKEKAEKRWEKNAGALPVSGTGIAPIPSHPTPTQPIPSQPLVGRRRLHAAWEGEKGLYVPQSKHSDFVALRNHPNADHELYKWYAEVAAAWVGSPGADMIKFWTARFDEKWPAPASIQQPTTRRPAWAQVKP